MFSICTYWFASAVWSCPADAAEVHFSHLVTLSRGNAPDQRKKENSAEEPPRRW